MSHHRILSALPPLEHLTALAERGSLQDLVLHAEPGGNSGWKDETTDQLRRYGPNEVTVELSAEAVSQGSFRLAARTTAKFYKGVDLYAHDCARSFPATTEALQKLLGATRVDQAAPESFFLLEGVAEPKLEGAFISYPPKGHDEAERAFLLKGLDEKLRERVLVVRDRVRALNMASNADMRALISNDRADGEFLPREMTEAEHIHVDDTYAAVKLVRLFTDLRHKGCLALERVRHFQDLRDSVFAVAKHVAHATYRVPLPLARELLGAAHE